MAVGQRDNRVAGMRRLRCALARTVGTVSVACGANSGCLQPPSRVQRQMLAWGGGMRTECARVAHGTARTGIPHDLFAIWFS
jgi:hypothetical protein